MRKFRIHLGLALFALAGVVGWVASFTSFVLWAVVAFLAWKGIMAFMGRIELPRTPAPSSLTLANSAEPQKAPDVLSSPSAASGDSVLDTPPPAMRTDHLDVTRAVGAVAKSTGLFMRRVITVFLLLLLVSAMLIISIGGISSLFEGNVLEAGAAFLLAGGLGWCCWSGPLRELWGGDGGEGSQATEDETRAGAQSGRGYEGSGGTAWDSAVPRSAPAQLSLPEEFVLLSYRYGDPHDYERSAIACAGAEVGELALRRRVRVAARKVKLFSFQGYFSSGAIHVLDPAPTGLAWADELLAELERLGNPRRRHMPSDTALTISRSRPVSLYKWLRLRGDKALLLHRKALTDRRVLFHSPGFRPGQEERHYPDPSVRDELISRLRAVGEGRVPMDEHMLLLLNLVGAAGLNDELGLTLSTSRPLGHIHGSGAVGGLSEDMREAGAMLAVSISLRLRSRGGGGNGGGGDGGE